MVKPKDLVQPGDCLLYAGTSPWSWVIKVKTWSPVSHSEVALNRNYTITSREGKGVNVYPFTDEHLYAILRPEWPPDMSKAMEWFKGVIGQPYGYWQALRFFRLGKEDTLKMMCSPCCARFYRAGSFHAFAGDFDASLVSPGMFLSSPHFVTVWTAAGGVVVGTGSDPLDGSGPRPPQEAA